jgi:hypothetical protein
MGVLYNVVHGFQNPALQFDIFRPRFNGPRPCLRVTKQPQTWAEKDSTVVKYSFRIKTPRRVNADRYVVVVERCSQIICRSGSVHVRHVSAAEHRSKLTCSLFVRFV